MSLELLSQTVGRSDDSLSVRRDPSSGTSPILDRSSFPQILSTTTISISLVYDPLDPTVYTRFTRSPTAGANVLFLGTTRNNFNSRPVSRLEYSAYPSLALKSLYETAESAQKKHQLEKVAIVHRLGEVNVEEESIAVSVSSAHRASCWKGAEEILERFKARAEIWKREWFADTGEVEEGIWRANEGQRAQDKIAVCS